MHGDICSGGLHPRHIAKVLEMSRMSQRLRIPGEPLEGTDEAQGRCSCYAHPVGRPRQEFRQQKTDQVSVVKQGSPTFPAS